ncbi:adhesion G protein-coupled receptor L3-like [Oculina patagonica]
MQEKCQDENQSDPLRNLPVFDQDSHVTYKNIFCARCNGAGNTTYWKLQFDCGKWFNLTDVNLGDSVALLRQNCSVNETPELRQLNFLKRCVSRYQDCHNISREKNECYCQTECLRYAFPVCSDSKKIRFRNLQCALCNGLKPNELETECDSSRENISPPLTILFDFTSTSKYSVVVEDRKENVRTTKEFSCRLDEVYDPFVGSCKRIVSTEDYQENARLHPNCTSIAFNKTDYLQISNGTFYLKLHNKIYRNTTYTIRDGKLLLCVNFSRNSSSTVNEDGKHKIAKALPFLNFFTSIGCIVSMVSLLLLLITYILFAELRNLPGKIIINLALAVLLYQSVFFSAVKTDDQDTRLAVAVLLHFFVLSSFTWMNVMAYDVHRTFTSASEGVVAHRQNQHGGYTKRLMKYCLYAWGSPVLFVFVCVVVDHVRKGSIGYGQGEEECFISQPQAILYSFVLPVTLLIIFNMFALGHTVIYIVNSRKRTQQVKNRQHGTSVAVICVKMASVMGVTWILGIAANLKALSFLWYPYVVLNSFQGLFIFLSFAASGKALKLYRSKLAGILKNHTKTREADKRN